MLINMQANCEKDFSDSNILSSHNRNKTSSVSDFNMSSKLNYHKQSEILDTKTRDKCIVEFCVKKQFVQCDHSQSILAEVNTRPEADQSSISYNLIALQQRNGHSDLKLTGIPATLQTATDCSTKQLKPTEFVTFNSRIRPEVVNSSVTKSSESQKQSKGEQRSTLAATNSTSRSKGTKENKTKKDNNLPAGNFQHQISFVNTNNSNNGPDSNPCGIPLENKKSRKNKPNNNSKPEKHKKSSVVQKNAASKSEVPESNTQKHEDLQRSEAENSTKSSHFVQKKVSTFSKSRFHSKNDLSQSKNRPKYQSAFDLSQQESSKRDKSISEHRIPALRAGKNALSVVHLYDEKSEEKNLAGVTEFAKSKVTPDKKRLCKSLSNLTADDVLSVPCSSIFDRKPTPPNTRKNLRLSQVNLNLKNQEFSVYTKNSKVRLNNDMSKHIKSTRIRQQKSNGKSEERDNIQTSSMKKDLIEDKQTEKPSSKKQLSSQSQEKNVENKVVKKPPRLPKSLLPFMLRKNRKKQNQSQSTEKQSKPMKVKDTTNGPPTVTTQTAHDSKCVTTQQGPVKTTSKNEDGLSPYNEATGFRKIKVPSKQEQLNIHSAYATRVARVRSSEDARTSLSADSTDDTSPKSISSHDHSRDRSSLMNLFSKDSKVVLRHKRHSKRGSLRHSIELSSSTDSLPARPLRKRPVSLAVPTNDNRPTSTYGAYSKSTQNLSCYRAASSPGVDHSSYETPTSSQNNHSSIPHHKHTLSVPMNNDSASEKPHNSSFYNRQDPPTDRVSVDVAELSAVSRGSTSQSITINQSKISHSPSAFSTPSSSFLGTSYLSVNRTSLASSYGSIFEEDPLEELEKAGIEVQDDEDTFLPAKANTLGHNATDMMPKTKPFCRQQTAPCKLHIEQKEKRRSISPSFLSNRFKSTSSQPNIVVGKPPSLPSTRNQSMKDLAHNKKPIKPTTPKPKMISSAGSITSLNKFTFLPFSTTPVGFSQADEPSEGQRSQSGSTQDVTLRSVEMRGRASAKNAQIRRRMSLQVHKSRNPEINGEEIRRVKEFEDFKRHSVTGLDFEKVRSTMANWSVAPTSGSGNASRKIRKKTRPRSELQNFRFEVAIPEHKEMVNDTNDTTADGCSALETASISVSDETGIQSPDGAVTVPASPGTILGSCFSEEDLSTTRDEEFFNIFPLNRSHSVNSNLNNIREHLFLMQRIKVFNGTRRLIYSSNHPNVSLTSPLANSVQVRPRIQGSTVSGISNESGYGSMSRRGHHLRPESGDEDVFTHTNSNRLSNGDFPSEDGLYVEALWDHVTMDDDELAFKVGDVIRVIDMTNADWWWGELDSKEGWFPATFVRILVNQHRDCSEHCEEECSHAEEENDCECSRVTTFDDDDSDSCPCGKRKSTSSIHCSHCGRPFNVVAVPPAPRDSKNSFKHPEIIVSPAPAIRKTSISRDQIRKNVINEIVNSEKVFVGHLKDVVQGYLTRCRNRRDMFSEDQISLIFGNIEEIYYFQKTFAAELESAVDRSAVHTTELGKIFLRHKSGFTIYSQYCNNHPQSLALLSQLFTVKNYIQFFETCRLIQQMIDISLDGFLLTPVQKICKYPLQLAELLKYTSPDHPDYEPVKSALYAMKNVAKMINERKRMMENIKKISIWQSSVMNWQGEDVLVKSNELVHSGEIFSVKQSKSKPKPRMAFLFDHQLVICKKDLLRKDLLYYKTRVDLDRYMMTPLEGYSPRSSANLSGDWTSTGSSSMQFGWRLMERKSGDSMIMMCKNEDDYLKWMNAFPREREIALSRDDYDFNYRDELAKDLLKSTLVLPRKPKDTSVRAPNYRYRARMMQEANLMSKQKFNPAALEKSSSGGFFGKFTSFRRTTTRESSAVVY